MRLVAQILAAALIAAGLQLSGHASPPATQPLQQVGPSAARLTADDLAQINRLVSGLGEPWIIIAKWPLPSDRDSWSWSAHLYFSPLSRTPGLCRGRAAEVTATISSKGGFDADKTWQLTSGNLTYAQVPNTSRCDHIVSGERDLNRPFVTSVSAPWEALGDGDLREIVRVVRAGTPVPWPISDVSRVYENLVLAETQNRDTAVDNGKTVVVERADGHWKVTSAVDHVLPLAPEFIRLPSGDVGEASTPRSDTVIRRLAGLAVTVGVGLGVFGFWSVFSGWRTEGGQPQFVLALLPVAMVFASASVPVAVSQLINGFAAMPSTDQFGSTSATMMAANRTLIRGAVGFLITMAVAALFQLHAGWVDASASEQAPLAPSGAAIWRTRVLLVSPIVILPVGLLLGLVDSFPRLFLERLLAEMERIRAAGGGLEGYAEKMASMLVASSLGGIVVMFLLLPVGVVTILIAKWTRFTHRVTAYSWVVFAFAITAGSVHLWKLMTDLRWLSGLPGR